MQYLLYILQRYLHHWYRRRELLARFHRDHITQHETIHPTYYDEW